MKKKLKVLNQKPILSPHQYLFASHLLPRIPFWEFKNKKLCKRILASFSIQQFLSIQLFLNFEFSSWIITSSSPFHERKIKWNFYPIIFAELHLVLSRNNSGLTSCNSHRWNVTRPIYELKKIPRNDRWSVVKFRKKKKKTWIEILVSAFTFRQSAKRQSSAAVNVARLIDFARNRNSNRSIDVLASTMGSHDGAKHRGYNKFTLDTRPRRARIRDIHIYLWGMYATLLIFRR